MAEYFTDLCLKYGGSYKVSTSPLPPESVYMHGDFIHSYLLFPQYDYGSMKGK